MESGPAIKEAIESGKLSAQAVSEMREIVQKAKLNYGSLQKIVKEDVLGGLVTAYMQRRYCTKDETVASVVIGVQAWLGVAVFEVKHSKFVTKKVLDALNSVVDRVSTTFREDPGVVAEAVGLACREWLDEVYRENGLV